MAMTSAFIRILFGNQTMPGIGPKRPNPWEKVCGDIEIALSRKHQIDAVSYVYGTENAEWLRSVGQTKIKLLSPEPVVYQPKTRGNLWRHKFEGWRAALEDYDEIVAIDWDVYLRWGPVPDNFWNDLMKMKASSIQMGLWQYTRPRCVWRQDDKRKCPNCAFIYLRNPEAKRILAEIDSLWAADKYNRTEEEAIAYWMDTMDGGWQGLRAWGDKYEPPVCKYKYRALNAVDPDETNKRFVFHHEK